MRLFWLALILSAIWTPHAIAQIASTPAPQSTQSFAPGASPSPPRDGAAFAGRVDEMQSELNRMRSLLSQMQMNLPFVAATENPLKHQFELDIEMWALLLDQLQRQLDAMRPATAEIPLSPAQKASPPGGVTADSRYHSLVENELVHSSRLVLPPRAEAPVYQNIHDVIWIAITDASLSFANRRRQPIAAEMRAGDVRVFPRNRIVSVRNVGSTAFEGVVVELKQTGLVTTTCDCSTEIEASLCGCPNHRRLPELWALSLGHLTLAGTMLQPGEAFKNLARRGNMLMVSITPLDLGDQANPSVEWQLAAGDAVWIPSGLHQFKNRGTAPVRFVTAEF